MGQIRTIGDYVTTALQSAPAITKLSGDRYKLPLLTEGQVYAMLSKSYQEVVESRGCELSDLPSYQLKQVAGWFVDKKTKLGVILMGSVGNGKTTMALAIHRTFQRISLLAENIEREQETQEQHEWAISLKKAIPSIAIAKAMTVRANPPEDIFIVDEFGEEPTAIKEYGTDIYPMCDAIYQRYDSRKPIILTTNLDPAGIQQKYGTRVADRLKEICELIPFRGKSYR